MSRPHASPAEPLGPTRDVWAPILAAELPVVIGVLRAARAAGTDGAEGLDRLIDELAREVAGQTAPDRASTFARRDSARAVLRRGVAEDLVAVDVDAEVLEVDGGVHVMAWHFLPDETIAPLTWASVQPPAGARFLPDRAIGLFGVYAVQPTTAQVAADPAPCFTVYRLDLPDGPMPISLDGEYLAPADALAAAVRLAETGDRPHPLRPAEALDLLTVVADTPAALRSADVDRVLAAAAERGQLVEFRVWLLGHPLTAPVRAAVRDWAPAA